LNYNKLLDQKNVVITCGETAVGVAIARLFAEHGANLAIGSKNASVAGANLFLPCDLADARSVESFCAEVSRRFPVVHALINNPWTAYVKGFEDSRDADDDLILQVYQHSIVQTLRAFWPAMLKNGNCSVVNISSRGANRPEPGAVMHATANGAIGGMTRVPAVEGGHREVRVNEIVCGNETYRNEVGGYKPPNMAKNDYRVYGRPEYVSIIQADIIDDSRRIEIESVAKAALFLASDMASYISGISLSVNNGRPQVVPT